MTASNKNGVSLLAWFSTSMVAFWIFIAIGPFIWTVWGSFKVQGCLLYTSDAADE